MHTLTAPPPSLIGGGTASARNAYFAVSIDAAVDLLEAREYQDMPRAERLAKAYGEQRAFLNGFIDPGLNAALDLRVRVTPGDAAPVSVALLGRAWGTDLAEVSARAERLRSQVHAALPRHVVGSEIGDAAEVARLLAAFPGTGPLDCAVITRHEITGLPSRPDAQVGYYFSAVPFNWSDVDWAPVYSTLMSSPSPLVLSVGVLPVQVPAAFSQSLLDWTSFYGRLARENELEGGLYFARQSLAPDAFAVEAERAFRDFSRRLVNKAFVIRIQLAAPGRLPLGVVETVAAAISPTETAQGSHLEHDRAVSAYEIRRPATPAHREIAEKNLRFIDFGLLPGRPEIWNRPDPPDRLLQMLSVLGDARTPAAPSGCRSPLTARCPASGYGAASSAMPRPTRPRARPSGSARSPGRDAMSCCRCGP